MIIRDLTQSSDEWLDWRLSKFTASDAAAAVKGGAARQKLLHEKHTGEREEADPFTQARFDRGHAAEANARPLIEQYLAETFPEEPCFVAPYENNEQFLNPLCVEASLDQPWVDLVDNGREVASKLAASLDGFCYGIDDEPMIWEHKIMEGKTGEQYRESTNNGLVTDRHYWQLEHQLLVTGASRALFCVSDGTYENMAMCWYISKPLRRERLIRAWSEFLELQHSYEQPMEPGTDQEWMEIERTLTRAMEAKDKATSAFQQAQAIAKDWQKKHAPGRMILGSAWQVSFKATGDRKNWEQALRAEAPDVDIENYMTPSTDVIEVKARTKK
tara:strand:- start:467 stop:1456 length:990 start_codon:yes stop_codon:yes gene_type:complete